jgi:hypothetical protein
VEVGGAANTKKRIAALHMRIAALVMMEGGMLLLLKKISVVGKSVGNDGRRKDSFLGKSQKRVFTSSVVVRDVWKGHRRDKSW